MSATSSGNGWQRHVAYMGEAVVTCAQCGARRTFRGSCWEVEVTADMWRNEHARAGHDSEGGIFVARERHDPERLNQVGMRHHQVKR